MKTTFEPNCRLDRFRPFVDPEKSLGLLSQDIVRASMQSLGDWIDVAGAATGESGLCYRTAIYHDTGDITWLFPHSNSAELISAWLDLAAELGDPYYETLAVAYADRLLSDPIKGLYRGERKEAHGLAWYWPDDGTYTGGYSMRPPCASPIKCRHGESTLLGSMSGNR